MENQEGRPKILESEVLEKVRNVIDKIIDAKLVDEVICALHSLAILLFPLDSLLFSGSVNGRFRNQILEARVPTQPERDDWWHIFYGGTAFPTLARILIYNVASNWLVCFPLSARIHVYDCYFVNGPPSETVQALVPALLPHGPSEDFDLNSVCSNCERLLILCIIENDGVRNMARIFGDSCRSGEFVSEGLNLDCSSSISRMAQLIASIPDKARSKAPVALTSHLFFKQVTIQLLARAQESAIELYNRTDSFEKTVADGAFLFAGEMFARICRRGSADILVSEMVPGILLHIRSCLSLNADSLGPDQIISESGSHFWLRIMEAMRDPYAVEKFSEELLRLMAVEHVNDTEAYWTLWMLFHRTLHQRTMRALFIDKFLLWKVFPICCLRWILQFSVLECPPPFSSAFMEAKSSRGLIETAKRLVGIWSKREFIQSTPIEQQAYITAAVGLSLEKLSKEELETTKDMLHSILQGVSCRLESPTHLVRNMASCVALAFSKVVDPKNPLYLDDTCKEDTINWEFGLTTLKRRIPAVPKINESKNITSVLEKGNYFATNHGRVKDVLGKMDKVLSDFRLIDPDEVIDPVTLNTEHFSNEEDDDESKSDTSDSSLQPYDLSDDDADLKRKFSQLTDIIAALRKTDDPDGVENALDVAEKLVRASPNELQHVSGDLAKALVHVRCCDVTIDGEEDSAEIKRHKALIALLITCPFETSESLTKLLYSPHVDTSQRILILDVMTHAVEELANAKTVRVGSQQRDLISPASGSQPWFLPSVRGPTRAGSWKEVSETGTILSFTHRYERELPSKLDQIKSGKSRRWSLQSAKLQENQVNSSTNKFPLYGAAFMLPAMQGFDKKRHGVDLLGQDFIVLGKLIYMLGVCMKCMAMHPEASALAPLLLDMLSSRKVSHHVEAYVRKSVLFAASCILTALHPSYVASALVEGTHDVSRGLEWIRTWAFHVADSDPDTECSTMAMTCLQLHAEMALQASRSLESVDHFEIKGGAMTSNVLKGTIIMPYSSTMKYQF